MIIHSQKRSFGTGHKVSVFTLGTMRSVESAISMYNIIKTAHSAGINHLETAPSYGKAEIFIGEALDKLDQVEKVSKENWVITTKVLPKGSFNELKERFFDSLMNLNVKKIHNLAKELWPINRSITGAGVVQTLKILQRIVPDLKIKSFKQTYL